MGGTSDRISAQDATVTALARSGTELYWLQFTRASIVSEKRWSVMRWRPADDKPSGVAGGLNVGDSPCLAATSTHLVWMDGSKQLTTLPVAGGSPTTVGKLDDIRAIVADDRDIFLLQKNILAVNPKILSVPTGDKDTSRLRVVAPRGMDIDAMVLGPGALYWTDDAYVMKLPR